jgi:hypothetical protein
MVLCPEKSETRNYVTGFLLNHHLFSFNIITAKFIPFCHRGFRVPPLKKGKISAQIFPFNLFIASSLSYSFLRRIFVYWVVVVGGDDSPRGQAKE